MDSMRWINRLLLCLTLAPAAAAADATNNGMDTLLLRNGDSMGGKLLSIDASQTLRWKSPDAAEPIEFTLDGISQLDLHPSPPPEGGGDFPCKVFLTQGGALEGGLVSCSRDTICLQTWYAGELKIPRKEAQSIDFLPTAPDIFKLAGPEGWTYGKVEGLQNIESGRWIFRNGAFYADKSASIARDLKLPNSAELQFDLAWSGTLNLSLALYTDSLQPILIADKDNGPKFGGFYSMSFNSLFVDVRRIKQTEPLVNLPPVVVPAFSQTNRVHIDIRARKKSNTLALAVDGQWLQVWTDTNGFAGEGTGVRFVQNVLQGGAGQVKISNLRLAPWDGVWESDQTNAPPANQDIAWLTNTTTLAGAVESIADGKMTLRGKKDTAEVPLGRVRRLAFAPPTGPARELPAGVHATFANGNPVDFQLESWAADGVTVRSPVFGEARFDPNAFRRLVFHPLDSAAAALTNGLR
jgi:hypothetical protein